MERQEATRGRELHSALTQASSMPFPPPPTDPVFPAPRRDRRLRVVGDRRLALGVAAVVALVAGLIAFRDGSISEPSTQTTAGPRNARSNFTTSTLENGWTRYASADEGFSLELPP